MRPPDAKRRPSEPGGAHKISGQGSSPEKLHPLRLTRNERRECETAADVAFAACQVVPLHRLGVVVVPDVVLIEGAAQGREIPATMTLRRADGRSASVYRLPARDTGCPLACGSECTQVCPKAVS